MKTWKGIILAGGNGSRLFPLTHVVNKHLLPVYDKPMIYYPLTTLMLGGVREYVVISSPAALGQIEALLGDGRQWGIEIVYRAQERAGGIAECFRIAEKDIAGCHVALALGDNIFHGAGMPRLLMQAMSHESGATIFGYEVSDPSAYGVVVLDEHNRPIDLEEKPKVIRSRLAVPGLYFYDEQAAGFARELQPSARGELEITDLNRLYLDQRQLHLEKLGRGVAWLDTGTHEALLQAANFIQTIQERQGLRVSCPEEIAFRRGWIDEAALRALAAPLAKTEYGRYLRRLADGLDV